MLTNILIINIDFYLSVKDLKLCVSSYKHVQNKKFIAKKRNIKVTRNFSWFIMNKFRSRNLTKGSSSPSERVQKGFDRLFHKQLNLLFPTIYELGHSALQDG